MISLVTGGSGSGKSAFAEDLTVCLDGTRRIYIATMYPFDKESQDRVKRHQQIRKGKNYETIECYTNLCGVSIPPDSIVLLECMSNLVANEMYQEQGAGERTVEAIMSGLDYLCDIAAHVCIVSNEVFSDGQVYEEETNRYLSYLGKINREVAKKADLVVEVVYKIPIYHKRNLTALNTKDL